MPNIKGPHDFLDLGDYNAACSMCGRKRKASELVRNWQGQFRCPSHNEVRHPQDYVRAVPDIQTPDWTQPECDAYAGVCFPLDISAVADYAVADCAICDFVSPFSGLPVAAPRTFIYLSGSGDWLVPDDWNPLNNKVECLGKGGTGSSGAVNKNGGGGGGAYSSVSNIAPVVGSLIAYAVADAQGTWFNGVGLGFSAVSAENGYPASAGNPGSGGQASAGNGDVMYSGGDGGPSVFSAGKNGGGGGGAGGPLGDGLPGGTGTNNLNVRGGSGGGSNNTSGDGGAGGIDGPGAAGSNDSLFEPGKGTGGGGGGGGNSNAAGVGGTYGGGGGGSNTTGRAGGAGVIVISYQPI